MASVNVILFQTIGLLLLMPLRNSSHKNNNSLIIDTMICPRNRLHPYQSVFCGEILYFL